MHVPYPETITLREARRRYFEANAFGPNGGYDERWVDFKLGPIPMPFPNTASRVRAVRYHDLHHVLTGYDTDTIGEFEIAAWEIAAGCKSFAAAWVLNLGGLAAGLLSAPRRTFSAFVRGRRQRTLYGEPLDDLLEQTVGEARARYAPRHVDVTPRASDAALFAASALAGVCVGVVTLAAFVPLVPFGLVTNRLRRRAPAS